MLVEDCTHTHARTQHSTAQHSTAQHTEQHGTARNSTEQHGTARNSTEQHGTARNSTEQHGTARNSTEQHGTARNSTEQHGTAQHSTAQHSTTHGWRDKGNIIVQLFHPPIELVPAEGDDVLQHLSSRPLEYQPAVVETPYCAIAARTVIDTYPISATSNIAGTQQRAMTAIRFTDATTAVSPRSRTLTLLRTLTLDLRRANYYQPYNGPHF